MLTSFNGEQYIRLYKVSFLFDGVNLKLEIYQMWQCIKNNV